MNRVFGTLALIVILLPIAVLVHSCMSLDTVPPCPLCLCRASSLHPVTVKEKQVAIEKNDFAANPAVLVVQFQNIIHHYRLVLSEVLFNFVYSVSQTKPGLLSYMFRCT